MGPTLVPSAFVVLSLTSICLSASTSSWSNTTTTSASASPNLRLDITSQSPSLTSATSTSTSESSICESCGVPPDGDGPVTTLTTSTSSAATTSSDANSYCESCGVPPDSDEPVSTSMPTNTTATQVSNGLPQITASGNQSSISLSSVLSCAQVLSSYSSASVSWSQDQSNTDDYTYWVTATITDPATTYVIPAYQPAQTTTLCDGNPRAMGRASITGNTTVTLAQMTTVEIQSSQGAPYPSSKPSCSINLEECQALYELNSTYVIITEMEGASVCDPGSITASPSDPLTSFGEETFGQENPTATPTASSGTCNDCMIVAAEAQILYWPVRTQVGLGQLCDTTDQPLLPTYDPVNATISGPPSSTFVTAGVTITSPSVGIALTSVSRKDGCYGTVATTVIPMDPDSVVSLRGDLGGGYVYYPFQYSDLLYNCKGSNGSVYQADGPGEDCWPIVPSSVYFQAPTTYAWANYIPKTAQGLLTIADDYRPDILLPSNGDPWMSRRWGTVEWGSTCELSTCGVWDPPKLLTSQSSADGPTAPAPITTAESTPTPTPATPADTAPSQVASTNVPGSTKSPITTSAGGSTAQAQPVSTVQSTPESSDENTSSPNANDPSTIAAAPIVDSTVQPDPTSADPTSPSSGGGAISSGANAEPTTRAGSTNGGEISSEAGSDPTTQADSNPNPTTQAGGNGSGDQTTTKVGDAGNTGSNDPSSDGSNVSPDPVTSTLAPAAGTTIASQIVSAGAGSSGGVVIVSQGTTASLAPGSGTTVGGQEISAGSSGVVIVSNDQTATLAPGSTTNVGGQAISADSTGGVVVENEGTTATLAAGSVTSVGGQAVSAAPNGGAVVISSGDASDPETSSSCGIACFIVSAINGGSTSTAVAAQPIRTATSGDPSSGGSSDNGGSESSPTSPGSNVGASASVITIGSQTFVQSAIGASSVIIQNGQTTATLVVGGNAATIGSQQVSAGSSGEMVVGTGSSQSTVTGVLLGNNQGDSAAVFTAGSQVLTVQSAGQSAVVVQNGQTTATLLGGSAVTFGTQVVSADDSGNVVLGQGASQTTVAVANAPGSSAEGNAAAVITASSQTFTALSAGPSSVILENSQTTATLALGGNAVTIGTQIVSANDPGSIALGTGASRTTVAAGNNAPAEGAIFTAGIQIYTAIHDGSSMIIENAQTTATVPLGGVATLGSHAVTVDSSGNIVVGTGADRSTITPAPLAPSTVAFGTNSEGISVASLAGGSYLVQDGSTTLTLSFGGSPVTIGNEIISAGQSGVVVNASEASATTISVGPQGAVIGGGGSGTRLTTIDIASSYYTIVQLSNGAYVLEGLTTTQTLSQGGSAVTINGEVLSAGLNGLVANSGTRLETIRPSSSTTPLDSGSNSPSIAVNAAATAADGTPNSAASLDKNKHVELTALAIGAVLLFLTI
ncbi:hypothetical protein LTR56_001243 [Elasticomyces elasticus]|nr:hypothetical protein LTR56_001243 [Elasticomyces elasticus]KAK3667425.1 hypothetical protein LTR22_001603 [Elasticomyces elasticus]